MSDYVTCPYDGRSYPKGDRKLATVPARQVNLLLRTYAENAHARDPLLEKTLDDRLGESVDGESPTERFAKDSADELVDEFMGRGGPTDSWYRLPCPRGPHFVPVRFTEAFEAGRASIMSLVGPGASGKTHVLAALAQRSCVERVLGKPPLRLDISTLEVEQHWAQFQELYVRPLFDRHEKLDRSSGNALQYTSLFMVCRGDDSGDDVPDLDAPGNDEWIAVTDSWGESATPTNITKDGWYLAAADTAVICIDGARLVEALRTELHRTHSADHPSAGAVAAWAADGVELDLAAAVDHAAADDAADEESSVKPLHYCETATDYLVDPQVMRFRASIGRAPKPNIVVTITKADVVEAALLKVGSPLAARFSAVLTDDPAKEADPGFLWERHKVVAVLLMASGFEPFVVKLLRRFAHPIFTVVSATGQPPIGDDRFMQVTPRGVDSLVVNHLISRHWFREGTRLEGRFGPDLAYDESSLRSRIDV